MLTWYWVLVYILMLLYMYIAPDKCWFQQKALITLPIYCRFKRIAFKSEFIYIFFMFHQIYIAPGRGRQSIRDKILMTTERPFLFAHMLQVSKWSLWNLILYTFFMILYIYIAQGQGQKTPWGQTFDVNRKPLSLRPFVASSKKISLNSDFIYIFFNAFPHVYSPGQGQTTLCGQNPDVNRKALSLCPFVASFKKKIFQVWFYT